MSHEVKIYYYSSKYYVCLYEFRTDIKEEIMIFLEKLFARFNSEENPLCAPKYQEKIKSFLSHTSMSVGDVVQIDNDYYVINGIGFKKLE
jgi:hypothetical protein